MNHVKLQSILNRIGQLPPTLGYSITENQFNEIAECAAKYIHKYGWEKYVDYMNMWRMKIDV